MNSLKGKTAMITGATSGIGKACALALAGEGCRVIITGRRAGRLEETGQEIERRYNSEWLAVPMDVREKKKVLAAATGLPDNWKEIDILINNAGLARGFGKMQDADTENWDEMIDTNIKGLLNVTQAVLPGMTARQKGDIVNLSSIAGHEVYPNGSIYCATKHAVDAITKGLRIDLVDTPIRVSSIDPGLVETEFSEVRFGDKNRAKTVYEGMTPLTGEDIAELAVFIVSRPAHVQIANIVVLASAQASATIVHRRAGD